MTDSIACLKRATRRRSSADEGWRLAVKEAAKDNPQRAVAAAAGVTHTRVQQILRDE